MKNITISIDRSIEKGKIKPMHGINNAPFSGADCSMFHYLTEAGIPYSRLHDTGGILGAGVFVDIANVFPNFDADPYDPQSYQFKFTDHLLKALTDAGVEPFYRLGCTIENFQKTVSPMRIFPPKDPKKWAIICELIIRHINEGWGNGLHLNVQYWEIWNEPDNEPNPADNPMWKGTMEAYFQLYEVTANHLKSCFPHLKIGGYASCGFYEILNQKSASQANVSSRTGYFIEFFERFLSHISSKSHKAPLDFFSWHSYADRDSNILFAEYARNMLDKFGFNTAESILNEWNPGIDMRGTLKDAANIAAMFIVMQNSPVDMLSYYDGYIHTAYGGMFNPLTQAPFKAYYSFKAFNSIYCLENQYALVGEASHGQVAEGVYAIAAAKDARSAIMLVNTGEACLVTLPSHFSGKYQVLMLDEEHNLACIDELKATDGFVLQSQAVVVLEGYTEA